jgi:hypothetical protein
MNTVQCPELSDLQHVHAFGSTYVVRNFDMPNFVPYTHVLIIRVWMERSQSDDVASAWRCVVEDAESMELFYFNSLEKLIAFLFTRN